VFYYTLLLNNEDHLFSDPDVRLAVSLALDRNKIIDEALEGWGDITTGPFTPGTWPYNESVATGLYDLGKARSVLSGAGWKDSDGDGVLERNGEELAFEILIDKGDLLKEAVGRTIKWQLYEAGIKTDIRALDSRILLRERLSPGKYQTALLQFSAAGDPDTFTYLFWHSGRIGSSNLARYRNPDVDNLIERGRSEYELDERRRIYRTIHQQLADDAASVFLFVRRVYMGADSSVEGIKAQPQTFYNSAREWKIEAQ
jgi:peptide/nickel transport system substrate-binding protein